MDKILIIILTIIAVIISKNILSLETISFPLIGGGKIIFLGPFAKGLEILFVSLIAVILLCIIHYIRYIFRGGKIRKKKNAPVIHRGRLKEVKINDFPVDEEEDIIDEDAIFFKYPEIKESILSNKDKMLIDNIKKIDSNFNEVIFCTKAYEFSKELIKTKIIKYASAEYIYEAFNNGTIIVGVPDFHSLEKIDEYYSIKLRVKEYKNNVLNCTYEMIFLKIIKKDTVALKCPRCGAPLIKNLGGICRYCFKYNDKEGKKKIKSNVSKFSYDIPIIKFSSTKLIPKVCINCGAPLKKEHRGICEYCKSDNKSLDSEWVMVEFYEIDSEDS